MILLTDISSFAITGKQKKLLLDAGLHEFNLCLITSDGEGLKQVYQSFGPVLLAAIKNVRQALIISVGIQEAVIFFQSIFTEGYTAGLYTRCGKRSK
ncbi:MAG: hypothetical protein Q8Q23_01745 [bacterium]|nr:hypothetical protein [bacterium]